MLSKSQEKLIRSLQTKMNRQRRGLCLVEGPKLIKEADKHIDFTFTKDDTDIFEQLVSTEAPQSIAAVARIPEWRINDLERLSTIIVLDGVQDPGNVGAIMRLCLGFKAGLILVESAEVSSPKVIRSSAGAFFNFPWIKMSKQEVRPYLLNSGRPIFRLEKRAESQPISVIKDVQEAFLLAGSEGSGIKLKVDGQSVVVEHHPHLESLNVGQALAIVLHQRYVA